MPATERRWVILSIVTVSILAGLLPFFSAPSDHIAPQSVEQLLNPGILKPRFRWRNLQQKYPVLSFTAVPTSRPVPIPKIQCTFSQVEDHKTRVERKLRQEAVKEAFVHSWKGYTEHAWLRDEVLPVTGGASDPFGGWGATLVDSLDTLWIMGMRKEFNEAVSAISKIDFRTVGAPKISVFETTIRFLGGLLGAYDVSGHRYPVLLRKAVELGDMLYMAFDTPNRMPISHWEWQKRLLGHDQIALSRTSLADIGSLSLEFTRLSQLTKNNKWYDAIAHITNVFEKSQNRTRIPGLWPVYVNALSTDFTDDTTFTLGGMADSMYEYLPKQYLMLGGQVDQYRTMYESALEAMKEHLFFRPMSQHMHRMLLAGSQSRNMILGLEKRTTVSHLSCFAGGMVALAAKAFGQVNEVDTARDLVEGCLWAGDVTTTGIMPESFTAASCQEDVSHTSCTWREHDWLQAVADHAFSRGTKAKANAEVGRTVVQEQRLPPGFLGVDDPRYILRPEVIESVFVLYRVTGDGRLLDKAWEMFQAVQRATRTSLAYSAVKDVRDVRPVHLDNMESFWTAETLKYFYLIFSDPDTISLDDYVLNTEAHPFLRPK